MIAATDALRSGTPWKRPHRLRGVVHRSAERLATFGERDQVVDRTAQVLIRMLLDAVLRLQPDPLSIERERGPISDDASRLALGRRL